MLYGKAFLAFALASASLFLLLLLLGKFYGGAKKDENALTLFRGLHPNADVFSLDNSFDLLDRRKQPLFAHQDLLNVNAETVFGLDSANSSHNANLLTPQKKVEPQLDTEASVLGRKARQFMRDGRNDKARKLYERALLLNPERPDLLTEYAEFIEKTYRDVTLADHLFTKALAFDSNLERALQAHDRLGPIVADMDQKLFSAIDNKRDLLLSLAGKAGTSAAMTNAKHENYFLHIFHTNAIEGNTLSLTEARYILETGRAVGGKSLMEHQEVLGLDAALQFISTSLLRRRGHIELEDILDIHYRVMAYADPFTAGRLRTNQVYIASYTPPEAERLPALLTEFVQWLNSPPALQLHPVELAALAHYKLVIIHPFKDGNGRTSRLLLNLILLHSGYPPVIVPIEERSDYYKTLTIANAGDIRPFIRFIANCTDTTMNWFMEKIIEINRLKKRDDHRLSTAGEENDKSLTVPSSVVLSYPNSQSPQTSDNSFCDAFSITDADSDACLA